MSPQTPFSPPPPEAPAMAVHWRRAGQGDGPRIFAWMQGGGRDGEADGAETLRRQAFLRRFCPEAFRLLVGLNGPVGAVQVDRRGGRLTFRRLVAEGADRRIDLLAAAVEGLRAEARALDGECAIQAPLDDREVQALERLGFEPTGAGGGHVALVDRAREDDVWMAAALEQARQAASAGEAPIGAVVVRDGRLVAAAYNRPLGASDPTAHAETLALREAARRLGGQRLAGCALYVTIEPCAMCAGALLHARIGRLVFGAPNAKFGAVQTVCALLDQPGWNHRVVWRGGVQADAAAALMQAFFVQRRG